MSGEVSKEKRKRKPGKIPNDKIKWILDQAGGYMPVADIMDALGCEYDDVHEVCARLRGMEKRPLQRVVSKAQDGKKVWARIPEREALESVRANIPKKAA